MRRRPTSRTFWDLSKALKILDKKDSSETILFGIFDVLSLTRIMMIVNAYKKHVAI